MESSVILGCVADFSYSCESGTGVECQGIAEKLGCNSACFYSDSIEAILGLQCGVGGQRCHRDHEGRSVFLKEEPRWSLRHVFRDDNGIADFLAKKARTELWSWGSLEAIPRLPAELFGSVS